MKILLNISIITILLSLSWPCDCAPPPSPEESYEMADVVFSGEVTNVIEDWNNLIKEVSIDVYDVWKGSIGSQIIILTGIDDGICGYNFQVNEEYLIYGNYSDDYIWTNICTRTNLLDNASEDLDYLNQLSICDSGYTEYDGECYYDEDLNFLTLLIYMNEIEFELHYDIGVTIWQNGRINTLLLEGMAIHEIPNNIQNLDSLVHLSFSDNELEYLPDAIGNLPSLNALFISNNILVEIPETIGNLGNLEFFHMPGNQLTELPFSISNLSSLISFNIDNNYFTTFPSSLLELNNLKYVYIANNAINSLPTNINMILSIQILSAYSNNISILPPSVGELSNLYHFDCANNDLTTIPETICNIYDNLTVFDIGLNEICPPYPNCLTEEDVGYQDTSECEEPSLCDEEIEVELWGECYSIENTTEILLPSSELTGVIPESIGDLINLNSLVLYNNQLSGEIPESIENLTNLMWLNLYNNQLTGEIPESIGNLTNLTSLDLGFNQFNGEIPESLENLTNLNSLWLYHNQLNGEIPINICNIVQNLEHFYIYDNQLCPPYPECLTEEDIGEQDTSECIDCPDSIEGDVNCDGELNVLDIVLGANMVLVNEYDEVADVNEDGELNILDLVIMVNWVLYGDDGACVDIDGNVYETVQIGDQLWMAENLKVTHYNDGSEIPTGYSNSEWGWLDMGAYAVYDDDPVNAEIYGNLYNYYAVDDSRGICPPNHHIPTDDEWYVILEYLGGDSGENWIIAGGKMKDVGTIEDGDGMWYAPNEGANNESDFTAIPAGFRLNNGQYYESGYYGIYWSSTAEYYSDAFFMWYLLHDESRLYRGLFDSQTGLSVRCLRD